MGNQVIEFKFIHSISFKATKSENPEELKMLEIAGRAAWPKMPGSPAQPDSSPMPQRADGADRPPMPMMPGMTNTVVLTERQQVLISL